MISNYEIRKAFCDKLEQVKRNIKVVSSGFATCDVPENRNGHYIREWSGCIAIKDLFKNSDGDYELASRSNSMIVYTLMKEVAKILEAEDIKCSEIKYSELTNRETANKYKYMFPWAKSSIFERISGNLQYPSAYCGDSFVDNIYRTNINNFPVVVVKYEYYISGEDINMDMRIEANRSSIERVKITDINEETKSEMV